MARLEIPLREDEFSTASMELQIQSLQSSIFQLRQDLVTHSHLPTSGVSGAGISDQIMITNLDLISKQILGDFTFGESGAIKMITDANNGLWLSPTGILGKKAGETTFAIGIDGSPTFVGTITGSIITGGTIQTVSGTGQRLYIESVNNTLSFYNASNQVVSQLGGGTYIGTALRITNDANTTDGVRVDSVVAGTGFRYTNDSNILNNAIVISQQGTTNNTNPSIQITRAGEGDGIFLDYNGTGRGILIDSASTASFPLSIINAGIASSISIDHNTNAAATNGIDINMIGANYGHSGIKMNISSTSATPVALNLTLSTGAGLNSYFLSSPASGIIVNAAVTGTQNKKIRVLIGDAVYFIPLYDA